MIVFRLASALVLLAALAAPLRADTIVLADGKRIEGVDVVSETWQKVEFRQPRVSAVQNRAAADVASVEYTTTSPDYIEAQKHLAAGNVNDAAAFLDAVGSDTRIKGHVRASAMIQRAEILIDLGAVAEAGATVDALLAAFPDTRHLARALLVRGKVLLARNETEAAVAAFAKLKEEAAAKNLGKHWSAEAEYNRLFALEVKGETKSALDGYLKLRAESPGRGVAERCALRIGRIHLASGKGDEALALFNDVIEERFDLPKDIAAAAFLGRGRVLFAKGQTGLAAAREATGERGEELLELARSWFREARLDFLRVVTVYPEVQSQQAEAMYHAGQCFQAIGDAEAEPRAMSLYRTAAVNYPNSSWGKLAATASGR